jgi:hypothetical protein
MRRWWFGLRAALRRVLDGRAREEELGVVAAGIVRSSDTPEQQFRVQASGLSRFEWDEAAGVSFIPLLVLFVRRVRENQLSL